MKNYYFVTIILVSVFLYACGISSLGNNFITPERPSKNMAKVYIYAPDYGVETRLDVLINNKKLIDFQKNSYFLVELEPGEYSLRADFPGLLGIEDAFDNFIFKKDAVYFLKIGIKTGPHDFHFDIDGPISYPTYSQKGFLELIDENIALVEIKDCREIIPIGTIDKEFLPKHPTNNQITNVSKTYEEQKDLSITPNVQDDSIVEDLKTLKFLYENQLITEKDYDLKRKELLDKM